MRIALALVLVAACGVDAPKDPPGPGPGPDPDPLVDTDEDGLPDQLEDHLMATFGPELRLPPDDIDWTRPANVDWYLPKVHMRFDHAGCSDDGILDLGTITNDNIHAQTHYTKATGLGLCMHNTDPSDLRASDGKHLEFFLQAEDDNAVHPGIPPARSDEWRTYIQVRPSSYVRASDGAVAAYDLQVWYFFAYNDAIATINHEADWEHMTVSISADEQIVSVYMAAHDGGHRFDSITDVTIVDGTHVVGYLADGSHATYQSAGTHAGPVTDDHTYDGGPTWHSWNNYANLGQLGHVAADQQWALYGGRWGEVGETDFTSGPPGPMFNGKWDTTVEYK